MAQATHNAQLKRDSVQVPVGNSGYYSEFLLDQKDSKAYIKNQFASNKIYYSAIDKAQEQYRDKKPQASYSMAETTDIASAAPILPKEAESQQQVTRIIRTRITIAELLNPNK